MISIYEYENEVPLYVFISTKHEAANILQRLETENSYGVYFAVENGEVLYDLPKGNAIIN